MGFNFKSAGMMMKTMYCHLMDIIPLLWWQGLLIICFWMMLFFLLLKKRRLFLFCASSALIAGAMLTCYYYIHSLCLVTVTKPIQLYAGPSLHYHKLGLLPSDIICYIEKQDKEWVCVQADKIKGWFPVR